jgi:hypothetical protein
VQSLSPLTLANFTAVVVVPKSKIELFYGGIWKTPELIVSYTGGQLLTNLSTSMGGAEPSLSVVAGSWSAEVYNPAAVFHPLHPTSSYTDVFEIGRKVRISAGIRVSGTDYFWPVMYGIIAKVDFNTVASTIQISGFDYSQVLADYKLREGVDLNFGGTRAFAIADGANIVTNGTFDVDLTGWTAYNGIIECVAGGYSGKCLAVSLDEAETDSLGYQRAKATLTGLVVGGKYRANFRVTRGTAVWKQFSLVVGTAENASDVLYSTGRCEDSGWLEVTVDFIATATTLYLALEKSSPGPEAPGSILFDELTIKQVQVREYPMTLTEYPSDPLARGCYLLSEMSSMGPPATYEYYYINEDYSWDRAGSILKFNPDWEMPVQTTVFVAYVYESQSPEDVVWAILANSGLYASAAAAEADAIFSATGITIDRVGFEAGTSGLEAIRRIAERCNYRFYFRYDGKPVFIPKPAIKADGAEDLALLKSHVDDLEYIKNDAEIFNRVTLTGELQDRESKDDLKDKAALMAEVSDATSIAKYGEKNLQITNSLWQTQPVIDAAAAAYLAELKTSKAYLRFALKTRPIPAEWGDTVKVEIPLTPGAGGVVVMERGIARDIKVNRFDRTILLEIAE